LISRRDTINKCLTKKNKILAVLVVSLIIAINIISWANDTTPIYRPLIQDMRLVDSVKISDVLDQERINYYADVKNHMLYVNQEQSELARVSLAKIGFVLDYPEIVKHNDLNKAYAVFIKQQKESEVSGPIWQQLWFLRVIKLAMGALVVIILILSVVRPALKELIYDEEEK